MVDLLLLGGPPASFLTLLRLVEPRMLPGAVVAYGVRDVSARGAEFLAHLRCPGSGYVSLPLPFDGGVEMAVRAA